MYIYIYIYILYSRKLSSAKALPKFCSVCSRNISPDNIWHSVKGKYFDHQNFTWQKLHRLIFTTSTLWQNRQKCFTSKICYYTCLVLKILALLTPWHFNTKNFLQGVCRYIQSFFNYHSTCRLYRLVHAGVQMQQPFCMCVCVWWTVAHLHWPGKWVGLPSTGSLLGIYQIADPIPYKSIPYTLTQTHMFTCVSNLVPDRPYSSLEVKGLM